MTTILISEDVLRRTYASKQRRGLACPKCGAPVEVRILRTGMIAYACSCGAQNMVLIERGSAEPAQIALSSADAAILRDFAGGSKSVRTADVQAILIRALS